MATHTHAYKPNWKTVRLRCERSIGKGGKAYKECIRHHRQLSDAITRYQRAPKLYENLQQSISRANASNLGYMNPYARLDWLRCVTNAFCEVKPTSPLYAVTLITKICDLASSDDDAGPQIRILKILAAKLLDDAGASAFGNIEFAVFPKTPKGKGYKVAVHFQGLAWGISKPALKNAFARMFMCLPDGTHGNVVIRVKKSVSRVIAYNLKAPAYGYRAFPRDDGSTVHNTIAIPERGHYQLLRLLRDLKWPDLAVAVGEGEEILRRAEKEKPSPALPESPPPDSLPADALQIREKPGALTLQTGVNPAIGQDGGDVSLQERSANASLAFHAYAGHQETSDKRLYAFLAEVYPQTLRAARNEEELKALVQAKRMTFNKASDLFALSLKLAIPAEAYNKRRASEWAMALRYLHSQSCAPDGVAAFFAEKGGINHCVDQMRALDNEQRAPQLSMSPEEAWVAIENGGDGFTVATNQLEMPCDRAVLIAERNPDNNRLLVRHAIAADTGVAKSFLVKLAATMGQKPHD